MADDAAKPLAEQIKEASEPLFRSIDQLLESGEGALPLREARALRLHGIFQQDDRDERPARPRGQGTRRYGFMVRVRVPGGRLTAAQLSGLMDLGDSYGNGTLRITSRQGAELHGVDKAQLRELVANVAQLGLTTFGTGGDVSGNVMSCPAPREHDACHREMQEMAAEISRGLLPDDAGYRQLWGPAGTAHPPEGGAAEGGTAQPDALYGPTQLPHKLKIGLALPDDNCTDVLAQDVGLLAERSAGSITGYEVFVGGGMGMIPSADWSYPALAQPLAYVPTERVLDAVKAIAAVYRDRGDRSQRSRARLKYLIRRVGVVQFRHWVEERLGFRLALPRGVEITGHHDHLEWQPQGDGRWHLGLLVSDGTLADQGEQRLKSALRQIVRRIAGRVRLTPHQNLLLCDVPAGRRGEIDELLARHGVATAMPDTALARAAMSCPALPHCSASITESRRLLPDVLAGLGRVLHELGLAGEAISLRIAGCSCGCARAFLADVALVGRTIDTQTRKGKFAVYLGGDRLGRRLNALYQDLVPVDQLVSSLVPPLVYFQRARLPGENFGGFCARQGVDRLREFAADFAGLAPQSA